MQILLKKETVYFHCSPSSRLRTVLCGMAGGREKGVKREERALEICRNHMNKT